MRQYIVFDFDDVIAETFTEFLVHLNKHQDGYGSLGRDMHNWVKEDFKKWDAAWTTGFSDETIQGLFAKIDYKKVDAVMQSVITIRSLVKDGHSVQIVTANPNFEGIRDWLDDNALADIPLTSTRNKMKFMEERGFSVIIDDKPKTLRDASRRGYHAVRFERPWNKNVSSPKGDGTVLTFDWGTWKNEHSVASWYQLFVLIKDLSRDEVKAFSTVQVPVEFNMTGMYDQILTEVEQFASDRREILPEPAKGDPNDRIISPYIEDHRVTFPTQKLEEMDVALMKRSAEGILTNANGAKQTDLRARYDLLPALAVAEVAGVLNRGAEKYGEDNWRGLSVNEILNHVIGHAIAYLRTGDEEDLAHAATRGLMALEIHLGGGTDGE